MEHTGWASAIYRDSEARFVADAYTFQNHDYVDIPRLALCRESNPLLARIDGDGSGYFAGRRTDDQQLYASSLGPLNFARNTVEAQPNWLSARVADDPNTFLTGTAVATAPFEISSHYDTYAACVSHGGDETLFYGLPSYHNATGTYATGSDLAAHPYRVASSRGIRDTYFPSNPLGMASYALASRSETDAVLISAPRSGLAANVLGIPIFHSSQTIGVLALATLDVASRAVRRFPATFSRIFLLIACRVSSLLSPILRETVQALLRLLRAAGLRQLSRGDHYWLTTEHLAGLAILHRCWQWRKHPTVSEVNPFTWPIPSILSTYGPSEQDLLLWSSEHGLASATMDLL